MSLLVYRQNSPKVPHLSESLSLPVLAIEGLSAHLASQVYASQRSVFGIVV